MGIITLSGTMTWEHAAALRKALVLELDKSEKTTLDFSALEKTDTGIVQVLIALEAACTKRKTALELKGPLRQEIKELFKDLGFTPQNLGEWVS